MNGRMITILVNDQSHSIIDSLALGRLRDRIKPDADLLVVNGFPGTDHTHLRERDQVVLIRRDEIPKAEELQALMVAHHTPFSTY
jgi:sulfur carrier protein ThiS adenylyltransferase